MSLLATFPAGSRGDFEFVTKSIAEADIKRGILRDVVMSREEWDRHGEKMAVAGMDLKQYKRNPAVIWHHQMVLGPIARALKARIEPPEAICDVEFDMDLPFAANICRQYARGFLKAFSIGALRKKVSLADRKDLPKLSDGSYQQGLLTEESEVFELSATPVGACRGALVTKSAEEAEGLIKDFAEMFELLSATKSSPQGSASPEAGEELVCLYGSNTSQLRLDYAPGSFTKSLAERGMAGRIPVELALVRTREEEGTFFGCKAIKVSEIEGRKSLCTEAKIERVVIRACPVDGMALAPKASRTPEPNLWVHSPAHRQAFINRIQASVSRMEAETAILGM